MCCGHCNPARLAGATPAGRFDRQLPQGPLMQQAMESMAGVDMHVATSGSAAGNGNQRRLTASRFRRQRELNCEPNA